MHGKITCSNYQMISCTSAYLNNLSEILFAFKWHRIWLSQSVNAEKAFTIAEAIVLWKKILTAIDNKYNDQDDGALCTQCP